MNGILVCVQLLFVIGFNQVNASTITDSDGNPSTRIVGGTAINDGTFPFVCSVYQHVLSGAWIWARVYLCDSTIVNDNWLLTSAHCVSGKDAAGLLVICGVRQTRSVGRIDFNPDYIVSRKGNDLALVLLRTALVFTTNVQPIPIFDQPISPFSTVTIVGYGSSNHGYEKWQTYGLQAIIVPILSTEACIQRLGHSAIYLTSDIVCTDRGLSSDGACLGDSSSPVFIATELYSFNLLGISAWTTTPCGSGPSMHTLISAHIGWILTVISPNLTTTRNNK
ncbi:uncharacterized protein LOC131427434 [Malaya genurostris]|uniref:uncharacterized protein LOC131427434 n=1 Tax=Malaya genurostris TaxID=325434 RepID=UPI0026F3D88A|nr:uncharacterized protein LOC131427434 [Malaya genurostris]